VVAGLLLLMPATGRAEPTSKEEDLARYSFLYKIAYFVEWPAEALPLLGDPFAICALGRHRVRLLLNALIRKSVQGRRIAVMLVHDSSSDLSKCQMLFVADSEAGRIDQILAAVGTKPILTVGEIPDFAKHGGMVEISPDEDQLDLTINLDAAQRAGLMISSKLLSLATVLQQGPVTEKR